MQTHSLKQNRFRQHNIEKSCSASSDLYSVDLSQALEQSNIGAFAPMNVLQMTMLVSTFVGQERTRNVTCLMPQPEQPCLR